MLIIVLWIIFIFLILSNISY